MLNGPINDMKKRTLAKAEGAVLLMTLSIILLLSIALMKTFENRSMEMAHLSTIRSTFRARMLARSAFRGILQGLQENGFFYVHQFLAQYPTKIPIPIPGLDGEISDVKIHPIDHKFNLHWTNFRGNSSDASYTLAIFTNLINQIKKNKTQTSLSTELEREEVAPVIAAIYDWKDKDEDPNLINDEYGIEQYTAENNLFQIKNRDFDVLSEVKLIPKFQELKLTSAEVEKSFKVVSDTSKSFINVNTATNKEIQKFLKRFEDVETYAPLYENRDDIVKRIGTDESNPGGNFFSRKYDKKSTLFSDLNDILEESGNSSSDILGSSENINFFKLKSKYLSIRYKVHVNNTTLRVQSVVELDYKNRTSSSESFDISKITIHHFYIL